ncbi:MAG: GNAT family N-acetyltransferase [Burkholderiales bacterium]|nr:GNAT family N-acetyltransferase [Burkholderiales bacterium]
MGQYISLRTILKTDFTPLHALIQAHPQAYFYSNIGESHEKFTLWFEQALADKAYVVVDNPTGKLLGSSRFYNHNALVPHAYIGYTWYDTDVMGTHVNPETKLLMLSYAFETLNLLRVGFEVDVDNLRSRAAVLKLGAKHEGILRHHRRRWSDGALSNTDSFSILMDEWAQVKEKLLQRLSLHP